MIGGPEVSVSDEEEEMQTNPFTAKITIKKSSNPFTSKVKISKAASTPKKEAKAKPNPFANKPQENKQARVQARQQEIEHLRERVGEAEREYEESLELALRKGVNRAQVKKLFDISDRKMSTLLGVARRLREASNGTAPEGSPQWAERKKKQKQDRGGATRKQAKSSPSQTETAPLKISSSKVAESKKRKAATRKVAGPAQRTRKRK